MYREDGSKFTEFDLTWSPMYGEVILIFPDDIIYRQIY